ncbi:MAG TPA: extracellular solute-binding protein [Kiritimatiellia bacterium]|nr:extracellular solute-binding protein [Kiritimatiellia bacterium]HMO99515.1 extracellular solute-binding protein [Kiritimatiellia bacterium]HMP97571.1 extracellular solute-binding protein [Kiritimatiellia bacterium]
MKLPAVARRLDLSVLVRHHADVIRFFFIVALAAFSVRAGSVEEVLDPVTGERTTVIHLTVHDWILPDSSRTDTASRAEIAAMREFVRQFPTIFAQHYRARYEADPDIYGRFNWDRVEVRPRRFSGIKVEGVESDLLAIAGRVAPDILYLNFRRSDTYIQQGFLHPLDREEDGYLASMSREEIDFRVHEKIWPVIDRRGPGGARQVWALPYGGALGKVLLYRKDLLDEQGVPYPDATWTWDDLLDACRRVSDPARGIYGVQFYRGKHEAYNWVTFLWSMGGDVLSYDEERDAWDVVFDDERGAVALDFYTRLSTEPWTDADGRRWYGYAFKDPSEAFIKWVRGEIAFAFSYIDEKLFSTINPDVTGMAPVPIGPTGLRGGELNSRMMGLFSDIKHPAVRDAAWEFIKFYDSRDAVAIKTRVMVEGGLGRFVNPKYLEMFGYPELVRLSPRGWAETFAIAIETGRPEPYGKHSNIAYDIMTLPLHEAERMALAGRLPEDEEARLAVLLDLLRKAGDKARRDMLDQTPPRELRVRRITAGLFFAATLAGFVWVFRSVARAFRPPAGFAGAELGWGFRRYRIAYLLMLPAVGTILFWHYVPLLRGSLMAFQDYRILGESTWAGLDNFGAVLWDGLWWRAVWNAWRYSFLVIALSFIPPVLLAVMLQEIPRGKIFFRTVFYLPAVATGLVVILLWKSFYEVNGLLNQVLMRIPAAIFILAGLGLFVLAFSFFRRLRFHESPWAAWLFLAAGLLLFSACYSLAHPALVEPGRSWAGRLFGVMPEPLRWLSDERTALLACVLPMVWAGLGPGCLIYLAALKGISDDFYEAADIDGATFIDKLLFIVFPMLKPLLIINFVGVFVGAWFGATPNILAMTGGGANTEVAGLHIFYKAFIFFQFGPATAMAWMLAFMLIGFTVYQLRLLARLEFRTTGDKT